MKTLTRLAVTGSGRTGLATSSELMIPGSIRTGYSQTMGAEVGFDLGRLSERGGCLRGNR